MFLLPGLGRGFLNPRTKRRVYLSSSVGVGVCKELHVFFQVPRPIYGKSNNCFIFLRNFFLFLRISSYSLAVHSKAPGHKFEFDNTIILLFESNTWKRKIREVIEITKNNTVNFKTNSARIGSIYAPVICDP